MAKTVTLTIQVFQDEKHGSYRIVHQESGGITFVRKGDPQYEQVKKMYESQGGDLEGFGKSGEGGGVKK
jgi:predicted lipoprotein with Yx(FWY)xxD motif